MQLRNEAGVRSRIPNFLNAFLIAGRLTKSLRLICFPPTTTPNEFMQDVHHRMPVMLARESWTVWLGETNAAGRSQLGGDTPKPTLD